MRWLYVFRILSLLVATSFAITALAFSVRADGAITEGQPFLFSVSSSLGIVAGIGTLLSLPSMLLRDCLEDGSYSSTVVSELLWLAALALSWLGVDIITLSDGGLTYLRTCSVHALQGPIKVNTLCSDMRFAAIFSFLTGVILLIYTFILFAIALRGIQREKPIWMSSVWEASEKLKKGEE